jgi:hypothetical protein
MDILATYFSLYPDRESSPEKNGLYFIKIGPANQEIHNFL